MTKKKTDNTLTPAQYGAVVLVAFLVNMVIMGSWVFTMGYGVSYMFRAEIYPAWQTYAVSTLAFLTMAAASVGVTRTVNRFFLPK